MLKKNIRYVAGVDEVGRGPLAGPFVIGAVLFDLTKLFSALEAKTLASGGLRINDVTDSKKLTAAKREKLSNIIEEFATATAIIEFSSMEIDQIGLGRLTQRGFHEAIQKLSKKPDFIITDAFKINTIAPELQTNVPKGDLLSITVGAASIIAKVYRDRLMYKMHEQFPKYGFDRNVGYGTREHMEALQKYGACKIHRRSFAPVTKVTYASGSGDSTGETTSL